MQRSSRRLLTLSLALTAGAPLLAPADARAEVDVTGVAELGGGVATGDDEHNPYGFVYGGALELSYEGFTFGLRALRTHGRKRAESCDDGDDLCFSHGNDLRTIGVDLGYAWELPLLHLGPRVGFGNTADTEYDDFSAAYVEPGAVIDLTIGWFVVGADLRYRVVLGEPDLSGLVGTGRIGFRL